MTKPRLHKVFWALAVLLYVLGIVFAIMTSLDSATDFFIRSVCLPTLLIITTIILGVSLRYWFRFWLWWFPNLLSVNMGLPKMQCVGVYTVILLIIGVVIIAVFYGLYPQYWYIYPTMLYVFLSVLVLRRIWLLFERTPLSIDNLSRLGRNEKPTKSQTLSHPGRSIKDMKKILAYNRFALQNPELPDYQSFESQLFACIQSYASLQQGTDNEDSRLDRTLRAAIMSEYIALTASNLRHIFMLSELEITHITLILQPGKITNSPPLFGIIMYANLSETVVGTQTIGTPKISSVRTPFYIECSIVGNQPNIQKIALQESRVEQSLIHNQILDFATKSELLYAPKLAQHLLPRAGLLASSGRLRKWTLASNFVTGHTQHHAFYLLSAQPYLQSSRRESYIIGCTIVPKTHDRIIVADKSSQLYQHAELLPIQRVSTESSDFSARFGIFIGQESSVASLELLSPSFMQTLLNTPVEISIEAIGRQIYVYLPTNHITTSDFSIVLDIMKSMHKELRL